MPVDFTPYLPVLHDQLHQNLNHIVQDTGMHLIQFQMLDVCEVSIRTSDLHCMTLRLGGFANDNLQKSRISFLIHPKAALFFDIQPDKHSEFSELFLVQKMLEIKKRLRMKIHEEPFLLQVQQAQELLQILQNAKGLEDSFFRRVIIGVTGVTGNLRVGFRCNQDCHFCWQDRRWINPPFEMVELWLQEMMDFGIEQLVITGGEPTLEKRLPELLAKAKNHGMKVMLQSNATTFVNPRYLQRVVDAQVDRIFVSLHASTAEISDQMTNAKGTFQQTVQGIQAALGQGLRIGLNCVVEAANFQDLIQLANFIVEKFVHPFPKNPIESMNFSRPQPYYDDEKWLNSLVDMKDCRPFLQEACRILQENQVIVDATAGSCGLPACVLSDFPQWIYLPQAEHVGMTDPHYSAKIRQGTVCEQCSLFDRCQGPSKAYFEKFGDKGLIPFENGVVIQDDFPLQL